MKALGLIGGTSWVSSLDYYKLLNRGVNAKLGGLHSAKLILYSVDFQEFKDLFDQDRWDLVAREVIGIAKKLEMAGAEGILLCSNTTHLVAKQLAKEISLPVLHIAEAVGLKIQEKGYHKVGLLGTQFTMEHGYFQEKLSEKGIETLIPEKEDRVFLNQNIFQELSKEIFTQEARERYLKIILELKKQGAEAIIYGCTEIPLLLEGQDPGLPYFDTLQIHADYGVNFIVS